MELTLEVVSAQRGELGGARSHTCNESGGSIGRGPDNSWVLPDPDHYVSRRHAGIRWSGGRFLITDTSTNGVFVNGAALGRDGQAALSDGDRLVIGDYEIAVRLRGDGGGRAAPVPPRAGPERMDEPEAAPDDLLGIDGAAGTPVYAPHPGRPAASGGASGNAPRPGRPEVSAGVIDPPFTSPRSPAPARPSGAPAAPLIPDSADFLAGLPALHSARDPSDLAEPTAGLPDDPDAFAPVTPVPPVARASPPVPPGIAGSSPIRSPNAHPPPGAGSAARPLPPGDLDLPAPVLGPVEPVGSVEPMERVGPPGPVQPLGRPAHEVLPEGVPLVVPVPGTGNRPEPLAPPASQGAATRRSVAVLAASAAASAAALDAVLDRFESGSPPRTADEVREIFGAASLRLYNREKSRRA